MTKCGLFAKVQLGERENQFLKAISISKLFTTLFQLKLVVGVVKNVKGWLGSNFCNSRYKLFGRRYFVL